MQDISTLQPRTLLVERATYRGPTPLQHLTTLLTQLGYVKQTKNHPVGRRLTKADVRRLLDRCFKAHPLYPVGRPPADADFEAIMEDIRTSFFSEEQN